ncbi:MAG TPA: tetratricopeptide repeat protein [Thiobacillaceae bacterium]|nr:tetratricopeptide repeat protein [Thiobacillaceae bacterium]
MRASKLLPLLFTATVSVAWADFDAGMFAYSMGNYEDAAREFMASAKRGETQGEYYMGLLHEEGQGVPKDYGQSMNWYNKAALKGDVDAAFALGRMYSKGLGVQQNRPMAYMWYGRAAQGGHYLGKQEQEKCAGRMQPDQLKEARQLAILK